MSEKRQRGAIPKDQSYYWKPAWQREERAAEVDMMTGRVHRFTSLDEALDWLSAERSS